MTHRTIIIPASAQANAQAQRAIGTSLRRVGLTCQRGLHWGCPALSRTGSMAHSAAPSCSKAATPQAAMPPAPGWLQKWG